LDRRAGRADPHGSKLGVGGGQPFGRARARRATPLPQRRPPARGHADQEGPRDGQAGSRACADPPHSRPRASPPTNAQGAKRRHRGARRADGPRRRNAQAVLRRGAQATRATKTIIGAETKGAMSVSGPEITNASTTEGLPIAPSLGPTLEGAHSPRRISTVDR